MMTLLQLEKVMSSYIKRPKEERIVRSHFGMETMLLLHVINIFLLQPHHAIWTFYFLKIYPTDDVGSSWAKVDRKTWRKRINETIKNLNSSLADVSFN
jgi:hypothetical protein